MSLSTALIGNRIVMTGTAAGLGGGVGVGCGTDASVPRAFHDALHMPSGGLPPGSRYQ